MSLDAKLETLRKKPLRARLRILYAVLLGAGIMLLVVLVLTFGWMKSPVRGPGASEFVQFLHSF
jgi:hypothetical protein